jgi:hypothetical protein
VLGAAVRPLRMQHALATMICSSYTAAPPVFSLVCLRPESFGFLRQLQRLSLSPLSFWGLKAPVIHQSGMGQYLATPNTEKETLHGSHERLKYGISAQQGWRKNMVRQEHGDPGAGTL